MLFHIVKSTVLAALLNVGAASAETDVPPPSPEPAAAHYGQCSENVTFVSAYCLAVRRANLEQLRDCMATAPETSQGYRARYLLCSAQVNRNLERVHG